jgi:hypothetical protein
VIAEGADAAGMSRSIPLAKMMDDALLCLYQNGEAVRPSVGYQWFACFTVILPSLTPVYSDVLRSALC